MNSSAPSIFENFNARNSSAVDVARTFVPSKDFSRLLAKTHTLVIGPRGSGKTTLLKMCQQQALDNWDREDADDYRKKVDFTSVLVPTDVSWGRQIELLDAGGLEQTESKRFAIAAFTTNSLRATAASLEYRASHRPKGRAGVKLISPKAEATLVKEICNSWMLPPHIATFQSLKHRMSQRLNEIHRIAKNEINLTEDAREARLAEFPYLNLSMIPAVLPAIEMFNDAIGQTDERWAFLFDELELAPEAIVDTLIASLRSVDERILFKLSLAPFSESLGKIPDALAATAGNDYSVIRLWYPHKEEGRSFCHDLWRTLLESSELQFREPEEVLGHSVLTAAAEEWDDSEFATAYRPKSLRLKRMKRLAQKDKSFAAFLQTHEINLDEVHKLAGDSRAKSVRKAVALVALRDECLDMDGKLRSRKAVSLYSGADSLFAIVEGNPRWFKGIIGELLQNCEPPTPTKITATQQARQVSKSVERFYALLRTIPTPSPSVNDQLQGLPSLLDKIGDYFFSAQVQGDFTIDPPCRFKVSKNADAPLVRSIGRALNAGAIVSMAQLDNEATHQQIRGEEFRLSYLLATNYRLLLRTGRAVSLETILNPTHDQTTPSLFGISENEVD